MTEESNRKRPRKTKLVPRSDSQDSNNSSQPKLKSELRETGSRPSSLEFSVDVEIEEFDNDNLDREFAELFNQSSLKTKSNNADDDSDLEHYFSFVTKTSNEQLARPWVSPVRKKARKTKKESVKEALLHYTFNNNDVIKELDRLTTSDNIADKMVEAEIRNNLCRVHNVKFEMPLLQENVFAFLENMTTAKRYMSFNKTKQPMVPVMYKCYICNKGWWHLYDFQRDCEAHTEPQLKVQIEIFSVSQCNIILYQASMVLKFQIFPIEGKCWRCNKDSSSHFRKNCTTCTACNLKFPDCYNLKVHEGVCIEYIKQHYPDKKSSFICPVCNIHCWETKDFGEHMTHYHDVRSDYYIDMAHKKCEYCFGIKYKDHFCNRWKFGKRCNICFRSFQHVGQVAMHQLFTRKTWSCPICFEPYLRMCLSVCHVLKHTTNYVKLYKCSLCIRMFKSLKDFQDHKLLFHLEQRNQAVNEKVYVPAKCIQARPLDELPTEKKQKVLYVVGGQHQSESEPGTSRLEIKNINENIWLAPEVVVDDELEDETAAIDEIIAKRDNSLIEVDDLEDETACFVEIIAKRDNTDIDEDDLENETAAIDEIIAKTVNTVIEVDDLEEETAVIDEIIAKRGNTVIEEDETAAIDKIIANRDNNVIEEDETAAIDEIIAKRDNTVIEVDDLEDETAAIDEIITKRDNNVIEEDDLEDETAAFDVIIAKRDNTVIEEDDLQDETAAIDEIIAKRDNKVIKLEGEQFNINVKQETNEALADFEEHNEYEANISSLNEEIDIVENHLIIKQEIDATIILDSDEDEVEIKKEIVDNNELDEIVDNNEIINVKSHQICIVNVKSEPIDDVLSETEMNDKTKEIINDEDYSEVTFKKEPLDKNYVETQNTADSNVDLNEVQVNEEPINAEEKNNYIKLLLQASTSAQEVTKEDICSDTDEEDDRLIIDSDESSSSEEFLPKKRKYTKSKSYYCSKCCEKQLYYREFKWHKTHCLATTNSSYYCSKCDMKYKSFKRYCSHFTKHDLKDLMCPECGKISNYVGDLCMHIQRHIKELFCRTTLLDMNGEEKTMYGCQKCDTKFNSKMNFSHWEKHLVIISRDKETGKKPKTRNCESAQTSEDEYKLVISKGNKDPNAGLLSKKVLDECIRRLLMPKNKNTLKEIAQCFICERIFDRLQVSKRHLVEHMLTDAHIKVPLYNGFRCQICEKITQKPEQYKLHLRIHGCLPVYKCELCNKSFSDSSNFTKHKKMHGKNFYQCTLCTKKFQSSVRYEQHMVEHKQLGSEGAKCEICSLVFTTQTGCRRHFRLKHTETRYSCSICHEYFPALKLKWDHEWVVHRLRKGPMDCENCDATFRRFMDLKRHAREAHYVVLNKSVFFKRRDGPLIT